MKAVIEVPTPVMVRTPLGTSSIETLGYVGVTGIGIPHSQITMVMLSEMSTVNVGAVDPCAPPTLWALGPLCLLPGDGAEGLLIPLKRLPEDS
jgi:hypothetical protein